MNRLPTANIDNIDNDAIKVVRRLKEAKHEAYLVGGCVRDLFLDRIPKDFDVATSATPNEIRRLFRNCRIVGRRFRLAHILFGDKVIETSTFRATPPRPDPNSRELLIKHDNVWGNAVEDAMRRDFTVNGLYLDVDSLDVIDHVQGGPDLQARIIRTIGDPNVRFQEDPVRMLRAIKFASRLSFEIESDTFAALKEHRREVLKSSSPRVLEEILRLLREGAACRSVRLLLDTGIATCLSPQFAALFEGTMGEESEGALPPPKDPLVAQWQQTWKDDRSGFTPPPLEQSFIEDPDKLKSMQQGAWKILEQFDASSIKETPYSTILAALLNPYLLEMTSAPGVRPSQAIQMISQLSGPIAEELNFPRREVERMKQLLLAQRRLTPSRQRRGRPVSLQSRDYFGDALWIYEITCKAMALEPSAELEGWKELHASQTEATEKVRKRRRGGRRRRRDVHR